MNTLPMTLGRSLVPSLFGDLFTGFESSDAPLWTGLQGGNGMLSCDVAETPESYVITTNVPGIKKEWVDITVERGRLTLSLKPEEETSEGENRRYLYRERRLVPMSRTIVLSHAHSDGVEAHLKDGVLTITVRKDESKLPKRIAIN